MECTSAEVPGAEAERVNRFGEGVSYYECPLCRYSCGIDRERERQLAEVALAIASNWQGGDLQKSQIIDTSQL